MPCAVCGVRIEFGLALCAQSTSHPCSTPMQRFKASIMHNWGRGEAYSGGAVPHAGNTTGPRQDKPPTPLSARCQERHVCTTVCNSHFVLACSERSLLRAAPSQSCCLCPAVLPGQSLCSVTRLQLYQRTSCNYGSARTYLACGRAATPFSACMPCGTSQCRRQTRTAIA